MRRRKWLTILVMILLGGCQTRIPARTTSIQVSDGRRSTAHYIRTGESLSAVLPAILRDDRASGQRQSVVLLRRGPEGQSQLLIDVDAEGHLIDAAQDVVLRNGDELILSTQASPDGLGRPAELAVEGTPLP